MFEDVIAGEEIKYRRTYSQFNAECERVARAFYALGVRRGDHVAIWATNYPQWLLTLFGAAKMGAILVTVNTAYKIYEAEYLLKQSDAKLLVACDGFKDVSYIKILNELCPEIACAAVTGGRASLECKALPRLKTIVTIDRETYPGMYNWRELGALADTVDEAEFEAARKGLDCHDVVNMQYTSGTTGFPKGVMLTHSQHHSTTAMFMGDCMKFTGEDRSTDRHGAAVPLLRTACWATMSVA